MRQQWDDLPAVIQEIWIRKAYKRFLAAGHSYAEECPAADRESMMLRDGQWAWEHEHRNRLERWSDGWYGMSWQSHRIMFRNNYIGHRNMQTYVGGPRFYVPPRRGPWLRFLRWLQVVPPRPLTVRDAATIMERKPWP